MNTFSFDTFYKLSRYCKYFLALTREFYTFTRLLGCSYQYFSSNKKTQKINVHDEKLIKIINTNLTIEVCNQNVRGTWHICLFDTSTKKFNRVSHRNTTGIQDYLFTSPHELFGINTWIGACFSEERRK